MRGSPDNGGIGWTNSETGGAFGALLLGYYDDAGTLQYAGRCGSAFTDRLASDVLRKLRPLETETMPIPVFPKDRSRFGKPLKPAMTHWVKPKMFAEINYATWEKGAVLRQTSFEALREDKSARQVRRT